MAESATPSVANVILRVRRQDRPDSQPRWEEFSVPRRPNMNIISCLQAIAANPVTTAGVETSPTGL